MENEYLIKLKSELDLVSVALNYILSSAIDKLNADEFGDLKKCIGLAMGELAVYKADLCVKNPFLDNI